MSPEDLAPILEAHQLTPSFASPTVWACKSKHCAFTAPATERAPAAEARHQAEVIANELGERLWWQANR